VKAIKIAMTGRDYNSKPAKFFLIFIILLFPLLLTSCSRKCPYLHNREITAEIAVKHSFPASPLDDFHTKELTDLSDVSREVGFSSVSPGDKIFADRKQADEIVVGFAEEIDLSELLDNLEGEGYQALKISREGNYAVFKPPLTKNGEADVLSEFISELQSNPQISYAEPNYSYYALTVNHPDDTYYSYQWNYSQIRLPQAWSSSTGSSNVRIAVLDTGISSNHPDLAGQIDETDGYNVIADNNNFNDLEGHGTHVAGIIAAATNNNRGVAGIMWDCTLVPVKVLENNVGSWVDIARGIRYAAGLTEAPQISQPVDIINLSLGGANKSETVKAAVEEAREEGIIIVAAAGNLGEKGLLYPAAFSEVISVGAVDFNYPEEPGLTGYSNYSSELDVLAPGGDLKEDSSNRGWKDGILSTYTSNGSSFSASADYKFMEGTSMAAPHVSGVIGLMLANGFSRDQDRVRSILKSTSMQLAGISQDIGNAGLLNAYWALHRPDNITVYLLREESGQLVAWGKQELPVSGGIVNFSGLPPGKYQLQAHLDVQSTGERDPGDYYDELDIDLTDAEEVKPVKLEVREIE